MDPVSPAVTHIILALALRTLPSRAKPVTTRGVSTCQTAIGREFTAPPMIAATEKSPRAETPARESTRAASVAVQTDV